MTARISTYGDIYGHDARMAVGAQALAAAEYPVGNPVNSTGGFPVQVSSFALFFPQFG